MYFDFCLGEPHIGRAAYAIDTIFYICGDATYRTPHKEITPNKNYFVCTVKGTGVVWYDGEKHELPSDTCMIIQPTRDFGYRCKDDCWHFWWFEFCGDCTPFIPNTLIATSGGDFKLDLFAQSLAFAKDGRWDIASLLFDSACSILYHDAFQPVVPPRTALWQTALRYIRDNLATVNVANLCKALNLSERTLRNLFYANGSKSPKAVILKTRLEVGRQLLESTALPISEIALQLGFSNQFHFSSAFKTLYGKSPQQHRCTYTLT